MDVSNARKKLRGGAWIVVVLAAAAVVVWGVVELTCSGEDSVSDAIATSGFVCKEKTGGIPRKPAKAQARLQANTTRPSVLLSLGHHATLSDDIGLGVKRNRQAGSIVLPKGKGKESPRDKTERRHKAVTASVVDWPRTDTERLDARMWVGARPSLIGNRVHVDVCVERAGEWSAGQYEGSISVFGPRVREFTYPIVVTTKWPPCIPIIVLLLAIAGFVLMALVTKSLTFDLKAHRWAAVVLGLGIAVAAAGLTYWGQYGKNPTWGDDPGAQIAALAVAGFTAAVGGLAAAERLLRPGNGKGKDGKGKDGKDDPVA